jgi:hypothetical protein
MTPSLAAAIFVVVSGLGMAFILGATRLADRINRS